MNTNLLDPVALAQTEIEQYISAQADAIAPELKPLVRATIKVERVGFTRNASNTPYVVYRVNDRRCCTFIKRSLLLDLVQKLLSLKYGITERLRSLVSSQQLGLSVKTMNNQQYIASTYLNKFLERYNELATKGVGIECKCQDMFGMCLHQVAQVFFPNSQQAIRPNKALAAYQLIP